MKKFFGLLAGVTLLSSSAFANPACPVCTIAIGASLEIAHRTGVPDSVVGLWAGALLALVGYWLIRFCDARGWHWRGRNAMLIAMSVASVGFSYLGTVKYNPVWICGLFRMDMLLFGTLCGAAIFILTEKLYDFMKVRNGGHAHFPFEKVLLPVVVLALVSWAMTTCL